MALSFCRANQLSIASILRRVQDGKTSALQAELDIKDKLKALGVMAVPLERMKQEPEPENTTAGDAVRKEADEHIKAHMKGDITDFYLLWSIRNTALSMSTLSKRQLEYIARVSVDGQ